MTIKRIVRGLHAGLVAFGASSVPFGSLSAQQAEPQEPAAGWELMSSPQVDLWYHGLALVGFDQIEGLPLYNVLYVQRVQEARDSAGVSTKLDQLAASLLDEFEDDPVFHAPLLSARRPRADARCFGGGSRPIRF